MTDKNKSAIKTYDHISKAYADKFSEPSDNIDDFLKLVPKHGKILDAGCGPGTDSAYMDARGFKVVGVDLSAKMLGLAKKKSPNIHFQQADIRKLKFDPDSFDGILASYSLIHVPKKKISQTIKSFHKILKPAGIICIGVQEEKSKEIFITEPLKPDEKIFVNVISADELRRLLDASGFKVLKKFMRTHEKEELEFNKFVVIAKKLA